MPRHARGASEQHTAAVGIVVAQVLAQRIGKVATIIRANHHILTSAVGFLQKTEEGLRVIQHIAREFFGVVHVGGILPVLRLTRKHVLFLRPGFFTRAFAARGVYPGSVNRLSLRHELRAAAETSYAAFAAKLLPDNTHPLLGVRLPRLRAAARSIARSRDARAFLARPLPQNASFEEIMVQGFIIGYLRGITFAERTALLDRLIPRLDNWSLCDSCCATYRFAAEHREAAFEWLQPYTRSSAPYERRFAVVMMLDHFLGEESWAARVAALLPALPCGAYYADMAAAWCACEIMLRYPQLAAPLRRQLPQPVLRLTLRKLRESRRSPR